MTEIFNAVMQKVQSSLSNVEYRKGLDPLSTCIRLALLKFKPPKTKLAFSGPAIQFDLPAVLQASVREIKGANRENLNQLRAPLEHWREWYEPKHPHIQLLSRLATDGLEQLYKSYSETSSQPHVSPLVCVSIEFYKKTLFLEETGSPVPLDDSNPGCKELKTTSSAPTWFKVVPVTPIPSYFKDLWSDHLLNAVTSLLRELDGGIVEAPDLIASIETILNSRDQILLR